MRIGIELEVEKADHIELTSDLELSWNRTEDPSLRNGGVEYVSRIFNDADEGFKSYFKLKDYVEAEGGEYNKRCGLHVHVSLPTRFTTRTLPKYLFNYLLLEKRLFELGDSSRHHSNFCFPVMQDSSTLSVFAEICNRARSIYRSGMLPRCSKYTALNLQCLGTIGTLEFRMLSPMTPDDELSQQFEIIKDIFRLSGVALKERYNIPDSEYFKLVSILLRKSRQRSTSFIIDAGLPLPSRRNCLTLISDRTSKMVQSEPTKVVENPKAPFEIFFGE